MASPPEIKRRRDRLIRQQARVLGNVERVDQATSASFIRRARKDATRELFDTDPTGPKRRAFQLARVKKSRVRMGREMRSLSRAVGQQIQAEAIDIAVADSVAFADTLRATGIEVRPLSAKRIRELAREVTLQGETLSEHFANMTRKTQRAYARQIRLGIDAGEDAASIMRRIRSVSGPDSLPWKRSAQETRTLVDSMVGEVQAAARLEVMQQNPGVIGWQWMATLDSAICKVCLRLSGGAWSFRTGRPLPRSKVKGKRFPNGFKKAHFKCRCFPSPVMRGEALADDPPVEEWLGDQPKRVRREILGVAGTKLFDSGTSIRAFIDQRGRPRTIAQMIKRGEG